jgi:hypothetical protein
LSRALADIVKIADIVTSGSGACEFWITPLLKKVVPKNAQATHDYRCRFLRGSFKVLGIERAAGQENR